VASISFGRFVFRTAALQQPLQRLAAEAEERRRSRDGSSERQLSIMPFMTTAPADDGPIIARDGHHSAGVAFRPRRMFSAIAGQFGRIVLNWLSGTGVFSHSL